LEQSLATITAEGKLELLGARSWSTQLAMTDDGLLQMSGGNLATGGLTVGATGAITGVGTVMPAVTDNGLIKASGGDLVLAGAVTGTGTIEMAPVASVELESAISAGLTVLFGKGVAERLEMDAPLSFAGTISSWGLNDSIELAGVDAATAQITGNSLVLWLVGGGSLDYKLANPPSGLAIYLNGSSSGTFLTLVKPKPDLLAQAVASWAPNDAATAPHSAAHAEETAALLAPHAEFRGHYM